jgi:hypothetical protein
MAPRAIHWDSMEPCAAGPSTGFKDRLDMVASIEMVISVEKTSTTEAGPMSDNTITAEWP